MLEAERYLFSLNLLSSKKIDMETKKEESTAPEKTIFDAIAANDLDDFKTILGQHKDSVDFFDENGMSVVQHAAYKGNKDMVQLLLDRVCKIHYNIDLVRV